MDRWEIPGNAIDEEVAISKVGRKGLEDLKALDSIIQVAERYGSIEFVTSEDTLDELYDKATDARGQDRFRFALDLFSMWREIQAEYPEEENFSNSSKRARTWLDYGVFDFLKDSNDRRLIASAMAAQCSIFLTMDSKTILPHRKRIAELTKLKVLRPVQYWNKIRAGV